MSYLKFDKNLMINLEQSLPKEMLRTNKSGAYHCTTIVGCNTRKQHGLLVIPIPEMDDKAHVLLSSLDESVIQHGASFNLGLHQYGDNVFSPNGHKYIREFNCENVPVMTFRVGGVVLTKEKVFISHENRILIKYTLVEAHSPTTLRFRPMLAFRNANDLCVENDAINKDVRLTHNGVSTCLYSGYPELFMQFSKPVEWINEGHWYKGIEYTKDKVRGIPYKEDLWVPGYFELPIKKGESIIFSASTYECVPKKFEKTYDGELTTRTCRTSFFNCLKNSAKQFYLKKDSGTYIMAGYPWYNVRARDELISLPGCTLAINHEEDYFEILDTFLSALFRFIDKGEKDPTIGEIDLPDIPLWTIWAIQQFRRHTDSNECRKRYGASVRRLVEDIRSEKIRNLKLNHNGLVSSNGQNTPVTWLSASINGQPIIPRTGYILEFNALWYNAVKFLISLYENEKGEEAYVASLASLAEKIKLSFLDTFLNDYGYLYDYVNGSYTDLQVRPNLAIAIGLEYSPLDRRQRKGVLDLCTRELLTPKGLRSLSPKSFAYNPTYVGNPTEREYAVHLGPARPWLFGFYADAYFKVFGLSGLSFIERMLIGYEDEMTEGCIGSLSEMYDGNPPYTGRGAVSTAKNVGEILRTIKTVKQMTKLLTAQSE
ncbi:glycogen debranching enzyme N-terminal domain-containing protein [Barnesiella sp. CU968]|jgi:predicted glycogen debranching enzyme|uniref:glycogen debranching enzyme N-terminal domain-containing protein n=1 Tax=Barnesiella sp. CU968 TaxID=2780099 RepID=UPI00195693BA|nr:glycogen debranching enzyme N-terminal domain-containing protein [Barnesiella sp. CU968]MBJ2196371.1 glycogen debranching enzyme family protein [Muribaculaceae bacterium]MCI9029134.1 4-alpha-glucanotransferase [Muribaculaceae bacterium]